MTDSAIIAIAAAISIARLYSRSVMNAPVTP